MNILELIKNNAPIIISIISLFMIILKYFTDSKENQLNHPHVSQKSHLLISGISLPNTLDGIGRLGKYTINYRNMNGSIYWGTLYLIDRYNNLVYTSQPFLDVKNNENIDIQIIFNNVTNIKTLRVKLYELLFKIKKKISLYNKTTLTHDSYDERFTFLLYFEDYSGNKFTFKQSPHNLDYPPKSQKQIHFYNLLKKYRINILRRKSLKKKTNYNYVENTIKSVYTLKEMEAITLALHKSYPENLIDVFLVWFEDNYFTKVSKNE